MTPSDELARAERELAAALAYTGERGVGEILWELDWLCEVRRLKGEMNLRALDLFCGAGGATKGLQKAYAVILEEGIYPTLGNGREGIEVHAKLYRWASLRTGMPVTF